MEVNSGAVKHMVELIWCVDEVDDTTLADLHDIWWFWWRLQTRYIHLERRLVHSNMSDILARKKKRTCNLAIY